jgi:hypothetical protein
MMRRTRGEARHFSIAITFSQFLETKRAQRDRDGRMELGGFCTVKKEGRRGQARRGSRRSTSWGMVTDGRIVDPVHSGVLFLNVVVWKFFD